MFKGHRNLKSASFSLTQHLVPGQSFTWDKCVYGYKPDLPKNLANVRDTDLIKQGLGLAKYLAKYEKKINKSRFFLKRITLSTPQTAVAPCFIHIDYNFLFFI